MSIQLNNPTVIIPTTTFIKTKVERKTRFVLVWPKDRNPSLNKGRMDSIMNAIERQKTIQTSFCQDSMPSKNEIKFSIMEIYIYLRSKFYSMKRFVYIFALVMTALAQPTMTWSEPIPVSEEAYGNKSNRIALHSSREPMVLHASSAGSPWVYLTIISGGGFGSVFSRTLRPTFKS